MQNPASSRTVLAAVALAAAVTAGCGKSDQEAKAPATQVAVRVNSTEITVHQLNAALSRAPRTTPESAARLKREVLNRLIDQQLAAEQAMKRELDRTPRVVQALEAARLEILARAYVEDISRAQPAATPDEVKRYYAEHPELFARRRVYSLEEIVVAPRAGIEAGLREQVARARSLREVVAWLQQSGAPFVPNHGTRAAEQLPMELLAKVHTMKDGEMRLLETGDRYTVVRVAASREEPVDEVAAAPRIQQYLFNRRASEEVANAMKTLKAGAAIEYFGEFAGDAAAADEKAKAEAEARSKAKAEAVAKAQAAAEARAQELAKAREAAEERSRREAEARAKAAKPAPLQHQNVEKGLSGLK